MEATMNSVKSEPSSSNSVYFSQRFPKLDARYVVLAGNLSLVVISVSFFYLQRSWEQFGLTLLAATLVECLFFLSTSKYNAQNLGQRLPSAWAEAASCLVLCRSKVLWLHPLMVTIAIVSKYAIRKNEKQHIFNPANFAIIAVLCFISPLYFEFRVDDYAASLYPVFHAFLVGLVATSLANVWRVTAGYFLGIAILTAVLFPYNSMNDLIRSVGPELGSASIIFAWLMITDPKSAPRGPWSQLMFGFGIALMHLVLRYHEVTYSRFIALFFVTAGFYFWEALVLPSWQSWRSQDPEMGPLEVRA